MVMLRLFSDLVYVSNNTIARGAENWPELIADVDGTPWLLLKAARKDARAFARFLSASVSCACFRNHGLYLASSRLMYSMKPEVIF